MVLDLLFTIFVAMTDGRVILADAQFELTLLRLAHEVVENYPTWDDACIIGIQESGVQLAEHLQEYITKVTKKRNIPLGKLDITFYRDDFRMRDEPLQASKTELSFQLEGQRVLLIDDVLYTGRTVQAAMSAMQDFGRPAQVELLTLIDRRFVRHLPIQADYTGLVVDAVNESYVRVDWGGTTGGSNQVLLLGNERS